MDNDLMKYVIATTKLYGLIHKNKVLKIFNLQNKDKKKTAKDIDEIYSNKEDALHSSFVYTFGNYFIHQAIQGPDRIQDLLAEKGVKPYYVPSKKELLSYIDDNHFEQMPEFINLVDYLKKNLLKDASWDKIIDICIDIYYSLFFELGLDAIFKPLRENGIVFESEEQIKEISSLVMNLSNSTRIWGNNGFTPNELGKIYEKEK